MRLLADTAEPLMAEAEGLSGGQRLLYILISAALTLVAGAMSGLTLGLMSMDAVDLEVLKRSGTETEKKHAARIVPVVKNQHLLLVTLLLCNAAAMEALPLFIDRLTSPVLAIILSVTVVLAFGEILPQAVCSRYGLAVGSYSSWLVRALMVVCWPIAWPISKLLDFSLGSNHSALFRRGQLKALVEVHSATSGMGGYLTPDEISVIRGALDLTSKTARQAMTPLDNVFMLSSDTILDGETLARILRMGHSRLPVHRAGDRTHLLGVVLVKELVLLDPDDRVRLDSMRIRQVPFLGAGTKMYDLLRLFQTGRSHMVFLLKPGTTRPVTPQAPQTDINVLGGGQHAGPDGTLPVTIDTTIPEDTTEEQLSQFERDADPGDVVGIITIEDVIEELIQQEIVDETDQFVDNERKQRVNAQLQARRLPESLRSALKLDRAGSSRNGGAAGRMAWPGAIMSRGNSGIGALPEGDHADALEQKQQLRRAASGRASISSEPSHTELRRSATANGDVLRRPLLSDDDGSDAPSSGSGPGSMSRSLG